MVQVSKSGKTHCKNEHAYFPDNYFVNAHGGTGCKECMRAAAKRWKSNHPRTSNQNRNTNLKHLYGIKLDDYNALLTAQNGLCAACYSPNNSKRAFHVDHDHNCCPGKRSCGKCVRGLLCSSCNTTLGHSKESIERLYALITYIKAASQRQVND